ncbi:hypothetical protein K7X08_034858 [Anisodus acutangulus]|uniref:Uncharacterized protein n=1 Tax=Anisodus acutangulus TaxID=402998 RepID=A0A9Q1LJ08_9SOLA|nr:hypothetical protein K7X08_034858 [Anisodus acutangulus]
MPSSSLHVVNPYYPVMNFDMSSSSMSGHEVPHYQTTTIVTLDEPFRKFTSFEPLSFTGLAQRFIVDLPAFSGHSSPTWRRLSFTDDAAETQMVVAQRRPKRERRNDVANDRLDESDSDSPLNHNRTDDEQPSGDDGHSYENVTARGDGNVSYHSNAIPDLENTEGPDDFAFTRDDGPVRPAL